MTTYIVRRLLVLPVIVLGVTMLIFAMLSLLAFWIGDRHQKR